MKINVGTLIVCIFIWYSQLPAFYAVHNLKDDGYIPGFQILESLALPYLR